MPVIVCSADGLGLFTRRTWKPMENFTDASLCMCVCLFVCVCFCVYSPAAFACAHETRLLGEIRLRQETGECVHILKTLHTAAIRFHSNLLTTDHTVFPFAVCMCPNFTNSLQYSCGNALVYFSVRFCSQILDLFILDTRMHSYSNDPSIHPTALPSQWSIPCAGFLSCTCLQSLL